MDLFEWVGDHVYPSKHALLLEPFKSIWEKDTSDNHEYSIKVFSYVEFMCSPKKSNTYYKYINIEEREKKVKEKLFDDPQYPTNTDMMLANMEYIEQLRNEAISYGLFEDAIEGAEKLRTWCRDFDLDERNPKTGTMILKPRDVSNAIKDIPDIIKKLEEARNQVISELNTSNKTRSDRQVNHFER